VAKNNGTTNGHAAPIESIYADDAAPAAAMLSALAEFEAKGMARRGEVMIVDGASLIGEAAIVSYRHPKNPRVLCIRPKQRGSIDPERPGPWVPSVRCEEREMGSRTFLICRPWRTGLDSNVLAALEDAFGRLQPGDPLDGYRKPSITAEPVTLEAVAFSVGGGSLWVKWHNIWHSAYRYPPHGRSAREVNDAALAARPHSGVNFPKLAIV
jgi:hypothetical protein